MKMRDGDLLSFLSCGTKLYVQQSCSVFNQKILNDTMAVNAQDIGAIQNQKFDLVVLSYPFKRSLVIKCLNLLSRDGQIVFCAHNQNIVRRMCWLLTVIKLQNFCRFKKHSNHRLYYIRPGFDFVVQVVSHQKFLSQQYFKQHYHWQFTQAQSTMKRVIKHFVFKTNTFYLLEQSFVLGVQKC